jgi:pimeloyl-ACP methyl ester carboxylesterase
MFYKVTGKGKAVVLVHGFIEEGSMWNDTVKLLAKNYKVIVPDLEGFGSSPLLSKKLSMEHYADALYAVLQEEKINKCVMLGHSMGGYIALHFAEKYPNTVTGFGLVNSHCFADSEEKKANRKKGCDFIARHGSAPFVRELYYNIFNDAFKKTPAGKKLIESLIKKAEKYTPEALIAANTAMMNRKGKEDMLRNAQVPVLLINGKQDESAPLAQTSRQASFAPVADVHFYNNCKHMSLFENKKETLKAIERFVAFCY